jgi:hypothetical protein
MPLFHDRRPERPQPAGEARKETRNDKRETRVKDAEKQMERKPFENGG